MMRTLLKSRLALSLAVAAGVLLFSAETGLAGGFTFRLGGFSISTGGDRGYYRSYSGPVGSGRGYYRSYSSSVSYSRGYGYGSRGYSPYRTQAYSSRYGRNSGYSRSRGRRFRHRYPKVREITPFRGHPPVYAVKPFPSHPTVIVTPGRSRSKGRSGSGSGYRSSCDCGSAVQYGWRR